MSLRSDEFTAQPKDNVTEPEIKSEIDPVDKLTEESSNKIETMTDRSMATKCSALTKDLPIKLSNITKLERDGFNFQHWEMDF